MKPPMKSGEVPTFVYVASSEGRTKIGIAGDCDLRMRQLRNASGVPVELVTARLFSTRMSAAAVERRLHRKFGRSRLHGEWFSTEVGKAVAALEAIQDPDLHIADWAPCMPPEIAAGSGLDRWKWRRNNQVATLASLVGIWGRKEGRERFLAQTPNPRARHAGS